MGRVDSCKVQFTRGQRRQFGRRLVDDHDDEPIYQRPAERRGKPFGAAKNPTLIGFVLDELERSVAHRISIVRRGAYFFRRQVFEVMFWKHREIGEYVGKDWLRACEVNGHRKRVDLNDTAQIFSRSIRSSPCTHWQNKYRSTSCC